MQLCYGGAGLIRQARCGSPCLLGTQSPSAPCLGSGGRRVWWCCGEREFFRQRLNSFGASSNFSAGGYLPPAFFFSPFLVTKSLRFAAFRLGFFRHSGGSSSPSIGGLPLPARSRIRKVSARSARRPLSRKYSSVRKAETFSATATLMSWLRATPSDSAALRNSSSNEGCSRNAKLLRLIVSNSRPARFIPLATIAGPGGSMPRTLV